MHISRSIFQKIKLENRSNYILVGLFLIFFTFEISIWKATNGFPAMRERGENFINHLIAGNFIKYGIINQRFTFDLATAPAEEAHPFYYTHNPSFTIYLLYILQLIGIKSIPVESFISIFILGLGLFYMYLVIKEYTGSELVALFVLVLSIFDYAGVLTFGFNTHKSWLWLLIFAPLYHLKKYSCEGNKYHLWATLAFYFLMGCFEYIFAMFLILITLLLKVFKFYHKLSWRRLLGYTLLSMGVAFLLHQVVLIWALGFDTFLKDFLYTYLNRVFGGTPQKAIEDFYASKGLLYWGAYQPPKIFDNIINVKNVLNAVYGAAYINILSLFFIICFFFTIWSIKNKKSSAPLLFQIFPLRLFKVQPQKVKFSIAFFLATILVLLMFSQVIYLAYVNCFSPFFVLIINIGGGVFLSFVFNYIRLFVKAKYRTVTGILCILFMLVISHLVKMNYVHLTRDLPIQSAPGCEILHKYKNHSFVINFHGAYINYFTNGWAKMACLPTNRPDPDRFIHQIRYAWAKDAITNREKYQNPDFAFILRFSDGACQCAVFPMETFKQYPLVERGKDFWIFDLRGKGSASKEVSDKQFKQLIASQKKLTPVDFYTNGIHSAFFPAKAAFDGNRKTMWHSPQTIGALGWLAVKLAHPAKLRGLTVTIRDDLGPSQGPFRFIIEGSNDNQNWCHITGVVRLIWETAGETKKIIIENNSGFYSYYKFDFTVNENFQWISIAEMELFGSQLVNLSDFTELAEGWLKVTIPGRSGCNCW